MSGQKLKNYNLRITSFPRIHITLIGMNSGGYRINGGIGFSISDPKMIVDFKLSKEFQILDSRLFGFSEEEKNRLILKLNNLKNEYRFNNSFECLISGSSLTHFGFGTSTATYLSCIEALFILNNKEYDEYLIKKISSRGGTSGIGINTYFNGGLIFDVGVINNNAELKPSSSYKEVNLPLVVKHLEMPNWEIGILLPLVIKNKTEGEEKDFFKKVCPIEQTNVEKILYEVVYGVLSSVIENNYKCFSNSINNIQLTCWKNEERRLYGNKLNEIEELLKQNGALGIGMSSLGPGIFFTSNTFDNFNSVFENQDFLTYKTRTNNESRIIEYA